MKIQLFKRKKLNKYLLAVLLIIIFALGALGGYFYSQKTNVNSTQPEKEENIYLGFLSEVYDKIQTNYWKELNDKELGSLFKLGTEKLTNQAQTFAIKDKQDFEKMITEALKIIKEDKKKEFAVKLANLVLLNLKPLKRNALYTTKDTQNLQNKVQNINPEINLYQILGIEKDASQQEIEEKYNQKMAELEESDPEQTKQELEQVNYAYNTLSNDNQKQRYDQKGIEPTVFATLIRPEILHVYIKKMSPTTLDELKQETEKFDSGKQLDTLILDLRNNIGGSIDLMPYLLGPFIGSDQYAYEFLHQGEKTPFKTKTGWMSSLVRYKKVVVLINEQTQSSAEVMAAALKKYNVGVLVGTTTKGWGTIETVMNIDHQIDKNEKYSIFIVHSLTLNDNNQPIEGSGVTPTISINDPLWEQQLLNYFHYPELIETVKEVWSTPTP